jgi:hypothetical protein
MSELQTTIEQAWEKRADLAPGSAPARIGAAVKEVIDGLDSGKLRVAEKINGTWTVHQWIKQAVLLSFRIEDNVPLAGGATQYFDKVPGKFAKYSREDFVRGGFRVVPPAMVRRGVFIAKNAVLMPSYVNIGAYVDEGTMVDTWAYLSGKAPAFMTAPVARSFTAAFPAVRSSSPARCRAATANASSIARSSSNASMQKPVQKPALTNFSGPINAAPDALCNLVKKRHNSR